MINLLNLIDDPIKYLIFIIYTNFKVNLLYSMKIYLNFISNHNIHFITNILNLSLMIFNKFNSFFLKFSNSIRNFTYITIKVRFFIKFFYKIFR